MYQYKEDSLYHPSLISLQDMVEGKSYETVGKDINIHITYKK